MFWGYIALSKRARRLSGRENISSQEGSPLQVVALSVSLSHLLVWSFVSLKGETHFFQYNTKNFGRCSPGSILNGLQKVVATSIYDELDRILFPNS